MYCNTSRATAQSLANHGVEAFQTCKPCHSLTLSMPLVLQPMADNVFSVLYSNVIIAQIIVVFYVCVINNLGYKSYARASILMGFARVESIVSCLEEIEC